MSRPNPVATGQSFGRLTIIKEIAMTRSGRLWECLCQCGVTKRYKTGQLTKGQARSCGCLKRENATVLKLRHGASQTRGYEAWCNAKRRCYDEGHEHYPQYGGRGITMSEAWRNDFAAFLRDMGPCPDNLTLDRIENNGNYEHGNCRWATQATQVRNSRKARLSSDGVAYIRAMFPVVSARVLAAELGVHPNTVRNVAKSRSWS